MNQLKKFIVTFENMVYWDYVFEATSEEEAQQKALSEVEEDLLAFRSYDVRGGHFELIDSREIELPDYQEKRFDWNEYREKLAQKT